MKIILAPNAFKGSLSAREAADAMLAGLRQALPGAEALTVPVADGGDGLTEVLSEAPGVVLGLQARQCRVVGPLGQPVLASYLYSETRQLAVIEMAAAAGLALLSPAERNPLAASTLGVGQLILAALDQGARHIVLGIGGSATHDGGMGMAQALGVKFFAADGATLTACGASLAQVHRIEMRGLEPRLAGVQLQVMCDVDNPLLGPRGAAQVFAPQKGAGPEQVAQLDAGLAQLATVMQAQLGVDIRDLPGAGAAGGLGGGAAGFLRAELTPGAEVLLDLLGFDALLEQADLVLTAEGRLDGQTAFGKAPAAVARRAQARGIPCIAIGGSLGPGLERLRDVGIVATFSLCRGPISLDQAMRDAAGYLSATTADVLNTFCAGSKAGAIVHKP